MNGCNIIRLQLIIAAALALEACPGTPPVRTEIQIVKEPIAIQPIKPADIPTPPGSLGKRPPTLRQSADRAFGGWCDAVAYILRADPLLRLSAGAPPAQLPPYPECEKH